MASMVCLRAGAGVGSCKVVRQQRSALGLVRQPHETRGIRNAGGLWRCLSVNKDDDGWNVELGCGYRKAQGAAAKSEEEERDGEEEECWGLDASVIPWTAGLSCGDGPDEECVVNSFMRGNSVDSSVDSAVNGLDDAFVQQQKSHGTAKASNGGESNGQDGQYRQSSSGRDGGSGRDGSRGHHRQRMSSSSTTAAAAAAARRRRDVGKQPSDTSQCYVILFGMGSEETEGIYTLRTVDCGNDGEPVNVDTVVAFENEIDAQRFATLLEASLRHQPAVYSTSWSDITEWCSENNARCRMESSGSLLIPPESNVSVTDWERALALQRGEFSVLEEEPVCGGRYRGAEIQSMDALDNVEEEILDGESTFHVHDDALYSMVDAKLAGSSLSEVRDSLEQLFSGSS